MKSLQAREPPQDLHAEQCCLGSILLVEAVIDEVSREITDADFYDPRNGLVYRAIQEMRSIGKPVDAVTLSEHLETQEKLKDVGGDDRLVELIASVPHAAHAVHYAKIIAEKSTRRRLGFVGTDAVLSSYDLTVPAEESISASESALHKLLERSSNREVASLGEILIDAMNRITNNTARGMQTRFKSLDDLICGMQPGNLAIIAARPSVGKTALAVNVAMEIASAGDAVGFLSLEMGTIEVAERMLSAQARMSTHTMRGAISEAQRNSLLEAAQEISDKPIILDGCDNRSIVAIESTARLMVRRNKISVLIVDYLQLITGQERRDSREQEVSEVSRRLKALAKSLKIPVIALCQLNRENEKRTDKRPKLSDLRESGAIEQDADIVLLLHRPEMYNATDSPGEAVLIVAKNRNGRVGEVALQYQAEWMLFRDLAKGPQYANIPKFDDGGSSLDAWYDK